MSRRRSNQQNYKRNAEARAHRLLEKIERYEEFKANLAPKLQQMLAEGKSAEEIIEFGKAMAAARTVTIVATEMDSSKALAASKDILDRGLGKAKERSEVEHKFSKLKEEELDALLASRFAEVEGDGDSDTNEH